jgi:transcriptional regulator with XRE-family HTH domain
MEPPKLDGRGKSQRNRARKATEEEVYDPDQGTTVLHDTLKDKAPGDRMQLAATTAKGLTAIQKRIEFDTQEALSLRAQGWSMADIAEALDVGVSTILGWFTKHRRKVDLAKVTRELDAIAVPLAVENLTHGLLAGDKDYTLETLKGRGLFRRHVEDKSEVTHDLPPLVIRFEGAPTGPLDAAPTGEKLVTGTVVGRKALPLGDRSTRTEVDTPVGVGVPSRPDGAQT